MPPLLITSLYSHKHNTGDNHPENSKRIEVLENLITEVPFTDWPRAQSSPATLDQMFYAHNEDYVFDLQDKTPDQGLFCLDGDTILSSDSFDAALHAAGAAIMAVDHVCENHSGERPPACGHDGFQNVKAFCATRPPGHHAEPNTALGFCLFNNIFIAARHAQIAHDIKKIAIVDFDVHHGNGTQTMAERHNAQHPDAPIFYISSHEAPLFPMTGHVAENNANLLNIPLPANCTSAHFRVVYEDQIFPALDAFKPDLLFLSSGFDAHSDDTISTTQLTAEDYGWLTTHLCAIADKYAAGRVVSILEGGYHLDALKASVREHLTALI